MKKNNHRTGMVDRIRAACRKLSKKGWMTRKDVFFEVDPGDDEKKSFSRTWQDLIDRKELIWAATEASRRSYIYNLSAVPKTDVRDKIYRAMHIKRAFCAADIHKLTDADSTYILSIFRKLAKAGWLELTGNKGKHMVFRVKNPNRFYLEFVRQ